MISLIKRLFNRNKPIIDVPPIIDTEWDEINSIFGELVEDGNLRYNIYEYLEHTFDLLYHKQYDGIIKRVEFDDRTPSSFHATILIEKHIYANNLRYNKLSKILGSTNKLYTQVDEKVDFVIRKIHEYIHAELVKSRSKIKIEMKQVDYNTDDGIHEFLRYKFYLI